MRIIGKFRNGSFDISNEYELDELVFYSNLDLFGFSSEDISLIESMQRDNRFLFISPDIPLSAPEPQILQTGDIYQGYDPAALWHKPFSCRRDKSIGSDTDKYTASLNGEGVDAYVIDTGTTLNHIWLQHNTQVLPGLPNTNDDTNGHGTHVCGLIGGSVCGIAPGVALYSAGTANDIFLIFDKIIENKNSRGRPSVCNLSIGTGIGYDEVTNRYYTFVNEYSMTGLDYGVRALIDNDIVVCIAAGNSNMNAGYFNPARQMNAIVVGALDKSSNRSSYSNYGSSVDIYAPGDNLLSSGKGANNRTYEIMSGTSMASPVVCGICALLRQQYPKASAKEIKQILHNTATIGGVKNLHLAPSQDSLVVGGHNTIELRSILYGLVDSSVPYSPGTNLTNRAATIQNVNTSCIS